MNRSVSRVMVGVADLAVLWRAKVMSATNGDELPAHPFFLATLFVPQSRSLTERPHPIVTAFLRAGQRNVIKHDRV